ncbi:E3 ubiquitin-protein ligase RGLG2-like [Phoenix dactylifera]|uniref:E3 ubiquitin-protein ligase RGLG2-like n=1 Tax=Phoenix dactylifera TaxID=42345 RepID=A0A8B8ZFB1_PHODC|nr:E3 ubiquitin-protein ligase RGLG2-like [Phoenix dactylifera]
MGGRSSREASPRSRYGSAGSFGDRSYSQDQYWGQRYPYEAPGYQNYPPPSQRYGEPVQAYPQTPPPPPQTPPAGGSRRRLDRRYSKITDDYNSVEQVTEALAQAGLESSNLIVGIDFTKSNEWTGKLSFHGRSLHHIGDIPNPYEQAISIIGQTLSAFDEDNLIPCYGFGDASTHDQDVFSFYPDERSCNGFTEALARYRELVPCLRLAGPTSFAPIIEMATTIVEQNGGQYHVLLIIADGQVTRSVDTEFGQLSSQEQNTVDAIVKASEFPLSIVLVGVGDGPWDMMKEFDDNIPARSFDNFQFVNFTEIMSKNMPQTRKEAAFALAALMEIPAQYKATLELGILGRCSAKSPERVPLPPPIGGYTTSSSGSKTFQKTSFQKRIPPYSGYDTTPRTAPTAPSASTDNQLCPICFTNPKDMAFGCGHQTCCDCGQSLELCPICRSQIHTRIKLY